MTNSGSRKWSKGKILQQGMEIVIYTLEKLHDVYDIYSRIIYSTCSCRVLHQPYFSFVSLEEPWLSIGIEISMCLY